MFIFGDPQVPRRDAESEPPYGNQLERSGARGQDQQPHDHHAGTALGQTSRRRKPDQ